MISRLKFGNITIIHRGNKGDFTPGNPFNRKCENLGKLLKESNKNSNTQFTWELTHSPSTFVIDSNEENPIAKSRELDKALQVTLLLGLNNPKKTDVYYPDNNLKEKIYAIKNQAAQDILAIPVEA